jgi:CelD/BcsL family acetyltransferase involved in cellulose biosynthesis
MNVAVARTIEDLEGLRAAWSAMQGDAVTADIDYYLELLRHGQSVQRPHVVLFERNGRQAGMVVARLETVRLVSKIGYKTVFRPRVRALRVAYGGLLGEASGELAPDAVAELMAALRRGEADVVLFPNLRTDGAAFAEATTRPPFLLRQHVFDVKVHRRLRLPESFDAFLGSLSRRTREGVRRSERRLLRVHGDEISVRSLDGPDDVDAFFAAARPVAEATYQGRLGVAVSGGELELALTRLAAERGWFRARVLYLGERPIAFWHGYVCRGVFQTHVPGFLPAYRELNVGTYLLLRLLEDLCADPSVEVLDFGFGDAEYKRRFGDEAWEEADVAVFAPSLTGVRVNAVRTVVVAGNRLGRRALGSGLVGRTKRAWRTRMAERST